MKKLISILMVLSLSFLMISNVAVPAVANDKVDAAMIPAHQYSISDPSLLQEQIKKENISVPDGYRLERIDCYTYHMPDAVQPADSQMQPSASGLLYTTKNVFHGTMDFYYPDYPESSDYYDGPATVSETFSYAKEVIVSTSVSIGDSTLNTTVGYNVNQLYTVTKTYSTTVPANKRINLKVYTVYNRTTFDIYNKITGNLVQQGAYTDKPVGLTIFQYTYSK